MTWNTCQYCGKKTNGDFATKNPATGEHPAEHELAEARQAVVNARYGLREAIEKLDLFHEYREFLTRTDIPARVRATVQGELGGLSYGRRDIAPEQDLLLRIRVHKERVAEREAALAALEGVTEGS